VKLVRETWREQVAHGVLRTHPKPMLITDREGYHYQTEAAESSKVWGIPAVIFIVLGR
jgi:hypothetical protein